MDLFSGIIGGCITDIVRRVYNKLKNSAVKVIDSEIDKGVKKIKADCI